jgi:DNA-binding NarL/FixJ family response regulator
VSESQERAPTPPELETVADAAASRLRAEIDEDPDAIRVATEALVSAVTSAMSAGHSLTRIARAEADGQENVRRSLRDDILKRVDRTQRQVREAEATHHRAIARAMRLGLSTREIAASARVTHGTIRAIANRLQIAKSPESKPPVGESPPAEGE